MSYLRDENGRLSSTRLIFLIGSFWNMAMTSILALNNVEVASLIAFYSAVQGVLIGLKLGQKPMEKPIKSE